MRPCFRPDTQPCTAMQPVVDYELLEGCCHGSGRLVRLPKPTSIPTVVFAARASRPPQSQQWSLHPSTDSPAANLEIRPLPLPRFHTLADRRPASPPGRDGARRGHRPAMWLHNAGGQHHSGGPRMEAQRVRPPGVVVPPIRTARSRNCQPGSCHRWIHLFRCHCRHQLMCETAQGSGVWRQSGDLAVGWSGTLSRSSHTTDLCCCLPHAAVPGRRSGPAMGAMRKLVAAPSRKEAREEDADRYWPLLAAILLGSIAVAAAVIQALPGVQWRRQRNTRRRLTAPSPCNVVLATA